jgi:hypothetical protein
MYREPSSKESAERLRRAEEAEAALRQPIVGVEPMPRTPPVPVNPRVAAARKAAAKRRQNEAIRAAQRTDKWTEILCRALTGRVAKRWHLVSFRGKNHGESAGVVDVIAIRRDYSRVSHPVLKPGDLFQMILVQMKGGSASDPDREAVQRLRAVKERYEAKEIVLFRWNKGKESSFSKPADDNTWKKCSANSIFG